jgi:GNAT superfamily N-acetyltransferase
MPVVLRVAGEGDIAGMSSIHAAESQDEFLWREKIVEYLKFQHPVQHARRSRVVLVAVADKVVGFIAAHLTQKIDCQGELQWIGIAVDYRGYGVARMLIAGIGAWFVQLGVKRVCVNVDFRNVLARRLYATCGARILDRNWMVWEDSRLMMNLPEAHGHSEGPATTEHDVTDSSDEVMYRANH